MHKTLPVPSMYLHSDENRSSPKSNPQERRLQEDEIQAIEEVFTLFDKDQKGFLDLFQLKYALCALGFDESKEAILSYGHRYNQGVAHGEECISRKHFKEIAENKFATRSPLEELKAAFKLFDIEGKGKIDFDSLKRVAQDLGEPINDQELNAMIDEFDLDNDRAINFDEFKRIMNCSK